MNHQKFKVNGHELLARVQAHASNTTAFKLTIKRYFVNAAGTVIAKGAIPSTFQTKYPVYLFNTFDLQGGYTDCQKNTPPVAMSFVFSGIYRSYFDIFQFAGANTIRQNINAGDQVIIYADDPDFPGLWCWIVISCEQKGYGSLLYNPDPKGIDITEMMYFSDSQKQYNESVQYQFSNYHTSKIDYLDPHTFRSILDQQSELIVMKYKFNLNNFNGINFYMAFDADLITLIFKHEKI